MSLIKLDDFEITFELANGDAWEAVINGEKYRVPVTTELVSHCSKVKFLVDALYWLASDAYESEDELDVLKLYQQIVKFVKLTDYCYFKKLTNPVYNLYRRTRGVHYGKSVFKIGAGLSMFVVENRAARMMPEFSFR